MSAAILFLAVRVCDVINKAGICGISVLRHGPSFFLQSFIGKE